MSNIAIHFKQTCTESPVIASCYCKPRKYCKVEVLLTPLTITCFATQILKENFHRNFVQKSKVIVLCRE